MKSIGIRYAQLNELSASLELTSLSATYSMYLSKVNDVIQDTAWDEKIKAGNDERKTALECGNINVDGTPMALLLRMANGPNVVIKQNTMRYQEYNIIVCFIYI